MLYLTGLNYNSAPIELREKLSIPKSDLAAVIKDFMRLKEINECVAVSTCNRFELYALINRKNAADKIKSFIAKYFNLKSSEIKDFFYEYYDEASAEHLFRVTASLDSMVIGESQILSQIRNAYREAADNQATNYTLNKLFHQAIKLGKAVRTKTEIGKKTVSISAIAVKIAEEKMGRLDNLKVLLAGAGETAELAMQYLVSRGSPAITVVNRTFERALALAEKNGASAAEFDELYERIADADIIISSTDSPNYIIEFDHFKKAMSKRKNKPILLIDIAVPRDIDPKIASIKNAHLINIDELNDSICNNMAVRKSEAAKAEKMIHDEMKEFTAWYKGRSIRPFVEKFRSHIKKIVENEIDKFIKKAPILSEENFTRINSLKEALINKITSSPITKAKNCNGSHEIHSCVKNFECLFNLNGESCDVCEKKKKKRD